ncbi:MAG: APC family permease [Chloroflexi bacterium]|nr:APC family permease [Chloroflexota bacterium]
MADVERPTDPSRQDNRGGQTVYHPDLEWRQTVRGAKPGDRYVRIATHRGFTRVGKNYLVTRPGTGDPGRGFGRWMQRSKRLILGNPIPTASEVHERLNKIRALAVFSSDALSSVAYATEEIMKVLVLGGAALLYLTLPISLVIIALLAIIVISYRQTIRAYPKGGGSYIVASQNLGVIPGLTAASALMTDYVLTVAVSSAAGVAAITSLIPELLPYTAELSVAAVALLALANLRGLREAGTIFAVPTYAFVVMMYVLIGVGLYRVFLGGGVQYTVPASALPQGTESLGVFLLLAAFAQGCTAMTGTEAISDGVLAFKPPESDNARKTLVSMGVILGTMFLGMSFLVTQIHIQPATEETVLSQLGRTVFGEGGMWVALQIATALILVLAANTAFADFPRLGFFLARDRFLPRLFKFRGDRLAFTAGIVLLAGLAIMLLIIFHGNLDSLIPLYAVGVFTSFTLSQAGMVAHWRHTREPGWQRSAVLNGIGMVATAVVTLVIASTKFVHGAWIVVLLIPFLITVLYGIHTHYVRMEGMRRAETPLLPEEVHVRFVVPIADLHVPARQALAYARALAPDDQHVIAVHVTDDVEEATELQGQWGTWQPGIQLVIIESPYRSLAGPLLAYVDALQETHPKDTVTVVLPEYVPSHWWEHLLHNQTALRLKGALLFHPGVVVTNVPYHISQAKPKPVASK